MLRRVLDHLAPAAAEEPPLPPVRNVPYVPPEQVREALLGPLRVPESERTPIFDAAKLAALPFDPVTFARDGYQVWPGVMLPDARERWVAALQSVQEQNDAMVMHDWDAIGWSDEVRHSGWTGPIPDADNNSPGVPAVFQSDPPWKDTGGLSDESRRKMLGGGQLTNDLVQGTGVGSHHMNELRLDIGQGFMPECFPPSHHPFLMDVITHPQMLGIHRRMLGEEIRFDQ